MFRYGAENEFVFDSRVVMLTGRNGSGKSSIPAILEDLFYNKNSRGVKKGSLKNRNTSDKNYWSEAEFSIDGANYFVRKETTSTTKLVLTKNGVDISGHTATQTYAIIQELFGMDFSTFSKLVYQSTNSSLDFLLATDANRKKFLVSLLGLERYSEIAKLIKDELASTKSELASVNSAIASLEGLLGRELPKRLDYCLVPQPYVAENLEDLSEQISVMRETKIKVQANNKNIEEAKRLSNTLASNPAPTKPAGLDLRDTTIQEHKLISERRLVINAELRKLSVPNTHCPACGTKLNGEEHIEHIKSSIAALKEEDSKLLQQEKFLADKLAEFVAYDKAVKARANLEAKVAEANSRVDNSLPLEEPDWQPLQARLLEEQKKVAESEKAIREAEQVNAKVDVSNAKLDAMLEERANVTKEIEELRSGAHARLTSRLMRLEVLNKAFGTKGLISYKIESTTKVFEGLINEYLSVLSDGRFNLVFEIEDTKLALKIFDNGEEVEINSLSSGEFNRVNTACLLAIRKMMSAVSKVNLNILFLDEVVSVLDKSGKDTLIDVLLQEPLLNSVVVSHGYTHPLATKIHVDVHKDTSYLSMEAKSVE